MLLAHLEEVLCVHAAGLPGHAHAHEGHGGTCAGVGGRRLHRLALSAHKVRRRAGGVHEGRVALQLLDHLLVFLVGLHTGNAEGDDLHAPQIPPLAGKLLIQRVRQLQRVAGQGGISDAHFADLCKRGLKRGQKLGFHLARNILGLIVLADVAADVGVEQQRVFQADAVLAEAANADVQIDARPLVHHPEGDGAGRAVFVARQLLGVEVVDALILGGLAAEGKALADVGEHVLDAIAQITGEDARLGGHVVSIFARLGAHIHHLALLHDEHALAVRHGDEGAVGDDVVVAVLVAGAACDLFPALHRQHVRGDGLAIKEFLPLVGQYAASRAQCRFHESHSFFLLFSLISLILFEPVFCNDRRSAIGAAGCYSTSVRKVSSPTKNGV